MVSSGSLTVNTTSFVLLLPTSSHHKDSPAMGGTPYADWRWCAPVRKYGRRGRVGGKERGVRKEGGERLLEIAGHYSRLLETTDYWRLMEITEGY